MYNIEKLEGVMSDIMKIVFFAINLSIQLGLAFFLSLITMYIFSNGNKLKKKDQTIFVVIFIVLAVVTIRMLPNPINHLLPSNKYYEQFENSNGNNRSDNDYNENEFIEDNSNATLISPELNIPLNEHELDTVHKVSELVKDKNHSIDKKKENNEIKDEKGNVYVTYNTKNEIEINEIERKHRKSNSSVNSQKEHESPAIKEMKKRIKDLEQLYRMSQYDGIQGPLAPKEHHTTLPLTTEDNIISRRIQQYTGPDIYNTDGYSYLKNSIWGVPTQRPPVCIGKPVKYPLAYQEGGLTKYGSI